MLELSHVSAFELAEHQITVNTVLPGAALTPGAINAKGPLSDGPATRPFFASDSARAITNQALAIDGGFSVS